MYECLEEGRSVCWVVIFYASDVIENGRRTTELSNAALQMKQDTNTSIEIFKVLRF